MKKTTQQFIEECDKMHGGTYDYSDTVYTRAHDYISVKCRIHGVFRQKAYCHLQGNGCPKCSKFQPVGREQAKTEFLKKAKDLHGDKFDYSRMHYKGAFEYVTIICPTHGAFTQTPSVHLKSGCKKCQHEESRNTQEEFVKRSIEKHGNRYDYSNVKYTGVKNKVEIICPDHGSFMQYPGHHMNGIGCSKCGHERHSVRFDEWLSTVKTVHCNKYDYSMIREFKLQKKVEIICPIHGSFLQNARQHMRGNGCRKCSIESITPTVDALIQQFRSVHGGRYCYKNLDRKTKYKYADRIDIGCKKHGLFKQRVSTHKSGSGCPKCGQEINYAVSKTELEFLDYVGVDESNRQKQIGKYHPDGLKDGIIYEFLGDYWHGNPKFHNPYDRGFKNTLYAQFYIETFERFRYFKKLGYTVKYIWESDWLNYRDGVDDSPCIKTFQS